MRSRRASTTGLALALLLSTARTMAQSRPEPVEREVETRDEGQPPRWPAELPGLAARVADPHDVHAWSFATRVDAQALTLVAVAYEGALAITVRHARTRASEPGAASDGCATLVERALRARDVDALRTNAPLVFRGAAFEPGVYRQSDREYDAELACIRAPSGLWLATAIARPSTGHTLGDAAALAPRLASALASPTTRRDFPLYLRAARVDLAEPEGDAPWVFSGLAGELAVPSETIASAPDAPGGLTVTVGRRPRSTCAAAEETLRPQLRSEGTLVDRPGYVPTSFGSRIRRSDDAPPAPSAPSVSLRSDSAPSTARAPRTRERYCADLRGDALVVTASFARDDADAMERLGHLLRALVRGAGLVR